MFEAYLTAVACTSDTKEGAVSAFTPISLTPRSKSPFNASSPSSPSVTQDKVAIISYGGGVLVASSKLPNLSNVENIVENIGSNTDR